MRTKLTTTFLTIILSFSLFLNSFSQDPNFHIYLCFGQSNMAGAGAIEAQDRTVDSRFQFMKPQDCPQTNQYMGNWYDAVPPLWGCTGGIGPSDYFGRTLVANLPATIKVGVVVVGIPGCKIELFGKTGYEGLDTYNNVPTQYNGSAYAWLLDLAKKAQQDGVIKGMILHQGESNTGDSQWANKVKGVYDNLIADLGLTASETPLLAGELLYQDQGGACWSQNSNIAMLPNVLQNSYVISAQGLPGQDQYHFNSEGNRTFGARYAQQMLSLIPNGPSVTITSPTQNSSFSEGDNIEITADASDTEGTITRVEFYNGTTKLGEDASSPYSFLWNNVQAGSHEISAKAYSNSGTDATSAIINIKVNEQQSPYGGTPHQIPGKIEFENYDVGGNGFAYYDTDAGTNVNPAPDFRTDEDVDIENCTDVGGGYNIGWAAAGEWTEYTVNVLVTWKYELLIRVSANGDNKTISLTIDDIPIATDLSIPNTGGWQNWEDVAIPDVQLTAGEHIIRMTIGESDFINLNYMEFSQYSNPVEPIQLTTGWNLLGCPIEGNTNVDEALLTIWDNVEAVKDMNVFYLKDQPTYLNSLHTMDWGKGYLVKVSQDCELNW